MEGALLEGRLTTAAAVAVVGRTLAVGVVVTLDDCACVCAVTQAGLKPL